MEQSDQGWRQVHVVKHIQDSVYIHRALVEKGRYAIHRGSQLGQRDDVLISVELAVEVRSPTSPAPGIAQSISDHTPWGPAIEIFRSMETKVCTRNTKMAISDR